jgi:glycosyltransferase involved in cell wall biosynthesis
MVAIVFNQIFPYRSPVFDLLGPNYTIIYSCVSEPNRKWHPEELHHRHIILKERMIRYGWEFFLHVNPDIFSALKKVDPDVVVLYGFGPTQQMALWWARFHHRKIVVWTDGWAHTEKDRSKRQLRIHKMFVRHASSCIASSVKGSHYLSSLGAEKVFISRIAVDNRRFAPSKGKRAFDLIYVAQLMETKCPLFIPELMKELPGKRLLIIGDGPLATEMLTRLKRQKVDFVHYRFIRWEDMHLYYQQAKLCILPTIFDHWGVVANEALAAGCPVITTEYAGCAGELVQHGWNGAVEKLMIPHLWTRPMKELLKKKYSDAAIESVSAYTFEHSAQAIRDAVAEAGKEILYRDTREVYEQD